MHLKPDFDGSVVRLAYVNQHLEDDERDWCAGRNFRGSVTEQRRLAIIFRSGGVVLGGLLTLRAAISAVPDRSRLSPHFFEERRCEVFAFPREALLMRLEARNALSNLVTL